MRSYWLRRDARAYLPVLALLLGIALASFAADASANDIVVTTAFHEFGGNAGACTLREAIESANADTAFGGCSAGSGADVIILPSGGNFFFGIVHTRDYGPDLLPTITSAITIQGNGSTISHSAAAAEADTIPASRTRIVRAGMAALAAAVGPAAIR
jgi:CSLREA domain-containing protein